MIDPYLAADEARRMALKWGGRWAVCWEPTFDGEGRFFVAGAGIYPSKEVEIVNDPIDPLFLENLWNDVARICGIYIPPR